MDIRGLGAGGVIVVGGVIYGVSGGLGDALSEDIKHISEVTYEERTAYMEGVVGEFAEVFDTYLVETEDYVFVGLSKFSAAPARATFVEVVTEDGEGTSDQIRAVKAQMASVDFCAQDEMTMFTDKGWTYHFSMNDADRRQIFSVYCVPDSGPELRAVS